MIIFLRKKVFNSNFYKIAIWALLILIALAMILPSVMPDARDDHRWIMSINGTKLYLEEYQRRLAIFKERLSFLAHYYGGTLPTLPMQELDVMIKDTMSTKELLYQEGKKINIHFDDASIQDKLL
ncbi:MAG: SurA N-terminal domain-containing protein, partial [Candidatus Babeliales bacterium]